jgi:hypothetical protein
MQSEAAATAATSRVRRMRASNHAARLVGITHLMACALGRVEFTMRFSLAIEVNATSNNPNAILSVWFLPGNFEAFLLVNNGGGRYSAQRPTTSSSVPPQIFIKSNFGGVSQVFDL